MRGLGNDSQIAYIHINLQKVSENIIFYNQKRNFLGNISREEGFYTKEYTGSFNERLRLIPLINIPSNIFINGNIALEKPHIILDYSSGTKKKVTFQHR